MHLQYNYYKIIYENLFSYGQTNSKAVLNSI